MLTPPEHSPTKKVKGKKICRICCLLFNKTAKMFGVMWLVFIALTASYFVSKAIKFMHSNPSEHHDLRKSLTPKLVCRDGAFTLNACSLDFKIEWSR